MRRNFFQDIFYFGFCPEKGPGLETRGGVKLLARKAAKLWTERIVIQEVWAVLIVNIDGAEVWTATKDIVLQEEIIYKIFRYLSACR